MDKKKVYTISNAHLDTIWSWDFETTVSKYIYRTLTENFELFEKYPDYKFNFEGSYRYELMKEYYPEKWEKMRQCIAKGRWNVCGSAFENGDVNVPSPEALFRNILIGNEYFQKNFGKRSCDIFLPDCFGFGYALPSIMHHANLKGFTTQKLTWGSAYGIPFDLGKWYGVDGNYVYGNTNPGSYVTTLLKVRDKKFVKEKLADNEKYDLPMTAVFHGVGDRGGAPKEPSVKTVCDEIKKNDTSDVEVLSAPADQIFRDIDALPEETKQKLPVWNNELVMTNHAVGGYTSRAIGKRWNRRNEEIADMAERACVTATTINGYTYPQETLTKAWKRVIAHQFHDDLPGTSVQRAYRRSWNDYAMSLNQFTNEYEAAVKSIASKLDTSFVKGTAVVVNNPMEYERTGVVTVKVPKFFSKNITVLDKNENEYPAQVTEVKNGVATVLICVTVPAMGYKVFDLRSRKCQIKSKLSASITKLENEKYIVTFNSNGDISSIFDKELKKEILQKPITTGIFNYNGSSSWPAWELNYEELHREPQNKTKIKTIKVVENGPCRVALEIVKTFGDSTFTSIVALSRGGKVVEVYNETEWRSKRHLAKECFSFTAESPVATYDLGLGAIKRGNMNDKLFEVPAQKWADISDEEKGFGVSVISECKYGWDKFDNNTLRLTLMHTPLKNYKVDSMQSMMELGLNRYSYAVYSHNGTVAHDTQTEARNFVMPLSSFIVSKHEGEYSDYSFGSLSGNAILRAVKKAENSDEIIIRVGESEKKSQKGVTFSLDCGIVSAREIFASEEHIDDVELVDGKLVFDLKPYEIKSFALTVNKADAKETKFKVDIIGNINAFSTNAKPSGELPKIKKTIPAEIKPDNTYSAGVNFELPKNNKAMLCGGQSLLLPEGTKKVHVLMASLNGDKYVKINGCAYKINDITEYYAGWDLYDFKEVAFTKQGKLGYEFTHSHTENGDAQCQQLFFWHVEVDNEDKGIISFPVDHDILVLSVVADTDDTTCELSCDLYDRIEGRVFDYHENLKEKFVYLNCKNSYLLNDKGGAIKHRNKGRRK
ncbi:MAG: alpha-mannosidase [Clostridia bacterium]|nr:alpha-mannosidase [Clostridia bacterium]